MVNLMNLITTLGYHTVPCMKNSFFLVLRKFSDHDNRACSSFLYNSMCIKISNSTTDLIQPECFMLQRPKNNAHAANWNLRLPKANFGHGNREFIVGLMLQKCKSSKLFFCSQNRLFSTITEPKGSKLERPKEFSEILENGSPLIKLKGSKSEVTFSTLDTSKLIHSIAHPSVLLLSYELIKSKNGNMTPANNDETLDGISFDYILRISEQLKAGTFKFKLARRILIPKPGKVTLRPLTIGSPREKIVQKALQLVLTQIFEPTFSDHSHGFRPKRSCLSALKDVERNFRAMKWVIEADLEKCFDSIAHDKLMSILKLSIKCSKTLALIKSALKAGYSLEDNIIKGELVGTSQGNVLSPLLCNIFLHKFDEFMEKIIVKYRKGSERANTSEYRKKKYIKSKAVEMLKKFFPKKCYNKYELSKEALDLRKNYVKDIKKARNAMWASNSVDHMDENYIKVAYIRYADDFIIGITGSHQIAVNILKECRNFLLNELALKMSEEKTCISDFNKGIKFLGTVITNRKIKQKPIVIIKTGINKSHKMTVTPRLSFHAPIESLLKRLVTRGLFKWNKIKDQKDRIRPTAFKCMTNLDHSIILQYFNSIIRGLLNYYKFVDNRKSLGSIIHGLKCSCALTLALKFKLRTMAKVFKKFGKLLTEPISGMSIFLPNDLKKLTHMERFKLDINAKDFTTPENAIKISYNNRLTKSILGQPCIICGSTDNIQAHHLKKIKDLKKKMELDFFNAQMAAINRKQVPLCPEHHAKLHAGTFNEDERKAWSEGLKKLNPYK
jgi:retron-type reverse transcriptase